jgi:serine/threonine-protein kinase
MKVAHEGLPILQFPAPPPVVDVAVPSVVGKPADEAKAMLEAAGYSVRQVTISSWQSPGVVAKQDPPAGRSVEAGALITLSVSDGTGSGGPPEPEPSPTPTPSGTSTP